LTKEMLLVVPSMSVTTALIMIALHNE